MTYHRYKVGDKVLIRADLEEGDQDDTTCYVHKCMLEHAGKVATITHLRDVEQRYSIDLDGGSMCKYGGWAWDVKFFTDTNGLPDTLVVNGKTYKADDDTPQFKPFVIKVETLDEAKNLWHRLNANIDCFKRYRSSMYLNFEALDDRIDNRDQWQQTEDALMEQNIDLCSWDKEAY